MAPRVKQVIINTEDLLQALEPFFRGADVTLYENLREFFERKAQNKITVPVLSEAEAGDEVDALAEIAAMAQPLGLSDLARNFMSAKADGISVTRLTL